MIKTVFVMITAIILAISYTSVQASTLSMEPPSIALNGVPVNLTADDADIDVTIDPTDDLPLNGTQTISTAGATDIDINTFPPQGVSVVIDNSSITVTNHTVTVEQ